MLIRTSPPAFSQNFSFELPQPEVYQLTNGIDLFLLRGIQQSVFKIEFIFAAGKWNEPIKGLSHFLATMLDKGTSTRSSKQIAETFDFYGAQLEVVSGYDVLSVSVYGLNKSLRIILPVVVDLLNNANFPLDELDLQKGIFIQNLRVNNKKTSYVASKLLRQSLFGKDHPYGSSMDEGDVEHISANALTEFFDQNFALENIFAVGNLSAGDFNWLRELLGNIRVKGKYSSHEIQIREVKTRTEKAIAEGIQASIRLGRRFINREHSDYSTVLMMNHILGGYFGSRLMKKIREEKGLTYGIYSSIQPFRYESIFSIGADVNIPNVETTLYEIQNEIDNFIQNLIQESEFVVAKNHFLGSQQIEASNPFVAIDRIKVIEINRLPKNYYTSLFKAVQNSSVIDMRNMARRYLDHVLTLVIIK